MSSFRTKRGKYDTTPVEVPRATTPVRVLSEPAPHYKGEMPDLSPGGSEVFPDNENAAFDIEREVTDHIARRLVEDIDRAITSGPATTTYLPRLHGDENYHAIADRIHLVPSMDWGAFVTNIEGRYHRGYDTAEISSFGAMRAVDMVTRVTDGFEGTMTFRATPGTPDQFVAAVAAAHMQVVHARLAGAVWEIEARHHVREWIFSFIFCPDGIPAVCGICGTDTGPMVVGASLRNFHQHRPVERRGRPVLDCVEEFLMNATLAANPDLQRYMRNRDGR
jgi:hypothetical protein